MKPKPLCSFGMWGTPLFERRAVYRGLCFETLFYCYVTTDNICIIIILKFYNHPKNDHTHFKKTIKK